MCPGTPPPLTDELLERISLPDSETICDCYNEFIYLCLTKSAADHLNSYDSDFEEDDDTDIPAPAEASNTTVSLRLPGDYIHYMLHGHYLVRRLSAEQTTNLDKEVNCAGCSGGSSFDDNDSVFLDAEETLPTTTISFEETDKAVGTLEIDNDIGNGNEDAEQVRKLAYLIDELVETERNYINTLERGITTYIKNVFQKTPIPSELINMKYHLFGNIEYIHLFHKSVLLPKMIACGKDSGRIADVFRKYLENDSFYGYVLYSLYHPKSQRLCEQFSRFFENHQNHSGDKLGVKSFILQPIQRLPRYNMMLNSIAKALRKSAQTSSTSANLQSVEAAQRMMEAFINSMNESMAVNDIVECERAEDDEVEMGFGVPKPATVLKEQNSENQILFLYPRECENAERNKPINILHQGKFKKVFPLYINDLRLGRQYQGKLFIFERCVIFTEQTKQKPAEQSKQKLRYRGHFDGQEVGYDFSNQQILRIVSEKDREHAIEVKIDIQNPNAANLAVVVELLRAIISKREKKEGFIIESTELTIIRNAMVNRNSSNRSSISSTASSFSFYNTCGPEIVEESPLSFYPKQDFNNNSSAIDTMINFHQYYEKALSDSLNFYMNSLPFEVREQLTELNEILNDMLKVQRGLNFRLFEDDLRQGAESDLKYLCVIFHDSLKQSEFEIFLKYVERSKAAEAILMSFEQYFSGQPKEDDAICLSIDAFLFLPIEYVNRCYEFFESVWRDVHGSTGTIQLRNTVLDYKINYVHDQLSLLRQRVNENYYIRQLIMDVDFLNEIELVQYSEIVRLEGSYANYRLFLMKTGLLCMKIKPDQQPDKPEAYSGVTFYCPYTKSTHRSSKRSEKRWIVYLDGKKTTLIFAGKQARHMTSDQYQKLANQMRAKARVKKRSFFRAND
ncbi:hypothetical protein pipiens_005774 [Culex pipiens pipiens]|uniref:DH domain-containing protein n=1 Tax=Culex pipiens pipiens TaxID=38569 RepID=A0ABD1DY22_CULPP